MERREEEEKTEELGLGRKRRKRRKRRRGQEGRKANFISASDLVLASVNEMLD